jgi:amino acid transporter
MNAFRAIYRIWVSLVTLAVIVQIGFAGYGAFDTADKVDGGTVDEDSYEDSFGAHIGLGYLIFLGSILLLLLSFGARGRQRILRSVGVLVLLVIQILLAWTGASAPYAAGALHPINAFIILGLLGSITYREWKVERMAPREPAAAPPPA